MKITEGEDNVPKSEYANEFLAGAEFTLAGKELEGVKLSKGVTSDQDSNQECNVKYNDDSITWTSIDKPVEFYGLPNGLYKLTEKAPDGYQPIKETEIRIDNGEASVVTAGTGVTAKVVDILDSEINIIDEAYAVSVKIYLKLILQLVNYVLWAHSVFVMWVH